MEEEPEEPKEWKEWKEWKECVHVRRSSLIQCPICSEWVRCSLCHFRETGHVVQETNAKRIKCRTCGLEQEIAANCVRCGQSLVPEYDVKQLHGDHEKQLIALSRGGHFHKCEEENQAFATIMTCVDTKRLHQEWSSMDGPFPTYHDLEASVFGCSHYQRGCSLCCPTCKRMFTCRFCHDEHVHSHKFDRFNVDSIRCMYCGLTQEVGWKCKQCRAILGEYYCEKCHLFSTIPPRMRIFHCDECGQCRQIEENVTVMHCPKCQLCVNADKHECHGESVRDVPCSVCGESLFHSREPFTLGVNCHHGIHIACYHRLVKSSFESGVVPKCPICRKCMADLKILNTHIEELLAAEEFDAAFPELKDKKVLILCNECGFQGEAKYHHQFIKCPRCEGFNTSQAKK
eukprot:TRINITY_DN4469_c0_g1_i2.p1 TRINITY_DN4469_c0_g1~~TRINITY_DN4469_c0_g1_i2.p1  ORF type:complete len:401 (+),score=76.85 TRINITY_DN4469_c0_g1_i2:366-1568(+)